MSLEIGLSRPLQVRRERVDLGLGLRILYASDLHLRPSQGANIAQELRLACQQACPQAVLLGGDLVDTPEALPLLSRLVADLVPYGPVGAVSGNHDALVGRSRVKAAVLEAGGLWLEDAPLSLPGPASRPGINIGPGEASSPGPASRPGINIGPGEASSPGPASRSGINIGPGEASSPGLLIAGSPEQAPRDGTPWALCAHYPTSFPAARRAGARLVMAGHLHGWQIVLGQWGEYLLPGALLSRWNGPRFEREGSTLLVSQGMTDLFPLRWNCRREVLDVRL